VIYFRSVTALALLLTASSLACAQTGSGPADEPTSFSLDGRLLTFEPSTVAEPLDFSGLFSMRLSLVSQRSFSWTDVRYTLGGLNATDPYQPGRPLVFPDTQALQDIVVRQGLDIGASAAYGSEIAILLREPDHVWHGSISSSATGSSLASGNLPAPASRGSLQQSEQFHWLTRDRGEITGPLGSRADVLLSGTGQWAAQSVPPAPPGAELNSRLLFGNVRARYQIDKENQLTASFSGSKINLSNWGIPAAFEALAGWRTIPSFANFYGFPGLRESDAFDHVQAGWSRPMLHAQYGFSAAHLDTTPAAPAKGPSQIDLETGTVTGAPPLANLAVRTRQMLQAVFEPHELTSGRLRHTIAVGGDWELANIRNRFSAPFDADVILENGMPAYRIQLNTPLDSRERIQDFAPYVRDKIAVTPWMTINLALVLDLARGSLPGQTKPDLIVWNSASPRAGLAISPPGFRRLTLRGSYARLDSPLAGRYLDFGNANSLGGEEFLAGEVVARFGGPYSQIDSHLKRPYADEFNVGAEARLPFESSAGIRLFRRDEKDRIAAVDTGVPPSAYRPVQILDPGPDSIPGTFDDQTLTVYAQDPATLGKDQYLLTNPRGLRMLNEGMVAEAGGRWRTLQAHASFMTVKSWGPANPGDSVLENDPGVIGALFQDPNSNIHAAGRSYFDRAYVGKIQLTARLPKRFGGIECANNAVYMDGLPFARQLLVTGLPQGPLLVATTVRGSPEGGNRAEYVLNWNLRLGRTFAMSRGTLRATLDVFNVTNAGNRTQENDISGPSFNQRLPVAIEPARFLRINLQYRF
jgi:hypothetical protein